MKPTSRNGRRLAWFALSLAATACASARVPSFGAADRQLVLGGELPRPRAASDVVTGGELRWAGVQTTGEGVRRLRPHFLRPALIPGDLEGRRATPSVYVDNVYTGGLEVLDQILLDEVEDIQFIRPAEARFSWGSWCACAGGVIHVRRTRGR